MDVDHDTHQQLIRDIEEGDTRVIDLWEDWEGDKDVRLYKSPALKGMRKLLSDYRLDGHFGYKL